MRLPSSTLQGSPWTGLLLALVEWIGPIQVALLQPTISQALWLWKRFPHFYFVVHHLPLSHVFIRKPRRKLLHNLNPFLQNQKPNGRQNYHKARLMNSNQCFRRWVGWSKLCWKLETMQQPADLNRNLEAIDYNWLAVDFVSNNLQFLEGTFQDIIGAFFVLKNCLPASCIHLYRDLDT